VDRDRACSTGIAEVEAHICHTDASEALDDLRRFLRTHTYLNKWQSKNISGQHHSTCAHALQHQVDVKVQAAKTHYHHSHKALLILHGSGEWEQTLQVLNDSDIWALNKRELTQQEKEQRQFRAAAKTRTADESREGIVVEGTLGGG